MCDTIECFCAADATFARQIEAVEAEIQTGAGDRAALGDRLEMLQAGRQINGLRCQLWQFEQSGETKDGAHGLMVVKLKILERALPTFDEDVRELLANSSFEPEEVDTADLVYFDYVLEDR